MRVLFVVESFLEQGRSFSIFLLIQSCCWYILPIVFQLKGRKVIQDFTNPFVSCQELLVQKPLKFTFVWNSSASLNCKSNGYIIIYIYVSPEGKKWGSSHSQTDPYPFSIGWISLCLMVKTLKFPMKMSILAGETGENPQIFSAPSWGPLFSVESATSEATWRWFSWAAAWWDCRTSAGQSWWFWAWHLGGGWDGHWGDWNHGTFLWHLYAWDFQWDFLWNFQYWGFECGWRMVAGWCLSGGSSPQVFFFWWDKRPLEASAWVLTNHVALGSFGHLIF